MASIDLRFETYIVRVTSPDPDDLDWLALVLECGFEPVEPAAPSAEAEVTLTVDAVAYDVLVERGRSETGPDMEGFAQDSARHRLERWCADADALLVRDPDVPAFYRLSKRRRAVEILVRESTGGYRIALMRVVRELAMDRVVATGGVLIHGAAARSSGGVIVVSGPKRRGKTTLLISLLEHTGVSYMSNDRCVLRVGDGGTTVRGLPTIVSVRRDCLDAFPAFRARLFGVRPDLAAGDAPSVGFGPHQFTRILSAPRASSGPAAAFLFPRVTANPERLVLRRLTAAEALERFHEGLFRADQKTLLGDVFAAETARGLTAAEAGGAAGRWVAANLPCFQVDLGGGGPPTAAECTALLARVLA